MNHYGTLAGADEYFAYKLHETAWSSSAVSDRPKALVGATHLIDALAFKGAKADASQALAFPRDTDESVPEKVEWACYEIAYALLDGYDPDLEIEDRDVISEAYAEVRIAFKRNPGGTPDHLLHNIPSQKAWRWLQEFLAPAGILRLDRVS